MNVLLDTHALLWLLNGDEAIADTNKRLLERKGVGKYVSVVSLWEIAVKTSIGKLELDYPVEQLPSLLEQLQFVLLSINEKHAVTVAKLPFYHKDPFDRLLIAQALVEDFTLVSRDANIARYDVPVEW